MIRTNPFDDDKLREECGIFGIIGKKKDASAHAALGLHALHVGNELGVERELDGEFGLVASRKLGVDDFVAPVAKPRGQRHAAQKIGPPEAGGLASAPW